jgi:hypothetical protein
MHPAKSFVIGGAQDPQMDLLVAQDAIREAGWWERAPFAEHWPLTTAQVAELLAEAGEFDVDEPSLRELIERRLLRRPGLGESGQPEWDAVDVMYAGGLLEAREQWKATPSNHDPKKHVCQIILEQARAEGEVESIANGPARFDVRHLFALLLNCDNREGRAKTLALLKAVLEVEHGVFIA